MRCYQFFAAFFVVLLGGCGGGTFPEAQSMPAARVIAATQPSAAFTDEEALRYIASYPDLILAFGTDVNAARQHYREAGMAEGRSLLFSPLAYIASYPDLITAFKTDGVAANVHYIRSGFNEGRVISFNPLAYIASYPDLIASVGTNSDAGALHYINVGYTEGRKVTFDPLNYIASYPDLIVKYGTSVNGAMEQYISTGFAQGRRPGFDVSAYIASYSDLIHAFVKDFASAVVHYIQNGFGEARIITFNASNYILKYPDILAALGTGKVAASEHFIRSGYSEGRSDLLVKGPKALILYDEPLGTELQKLGFSYAIMLQNLLGHFDLDVELMPVQRYAAGTIDSSAVTFYLGATYDHQLPAQFLTDAALTKKTLVWFKYNLWQLAGDPSYNFTGTKGLAFHGLRGLNAIPTAGNPAPGFFDTVVYKDMPFVKYYKYDDAAKVVNADPDIGLTSIADASKAVALVSIKNPQTGEVAPYVARSGNFWYVADMPFSYIGPRDRYLVLSDLLHDMVNIPHSEQHKALVRLEDVGAMVSTAAMKALTDYLYGVAVPFSIAVIPQYADPNGVNSGGVPEWIHLTQATALNASLQYALPKGGEIVMHGYTHQYGNLRNPHTGASGDDYEFWNISTNSPVAEDSTQWALGRLHTGVYDLVSAGYNPVAWEAPHNHASALSAKAAASVFSTTYQRAVYFTADKPDFTTSVAKDFGAGQSFPYVIRRDYYGQRVLPENLGNIEYSNPADPMSINYTADDLILNARYAKTIRDGYASFFFHPFLVEPEFGKPGLADFKKVIEGISQLGFTWVAASRAQ